MKVATNHGQDKRSVVDLMVEVCCICQEHVEIEQDHVYSDKRYAHLRCYFETIMEFKNAPRPVKFECAKIISRSRQKRP